MPAVPPGRQEACKKKKEKEREKESRRFGTIRESFTLPPG